MSDIQVAVDPLFLALPPSPPAEAYIERIPPQQRFSQIGKTIERRRTDIAYTTLLSSIHLSAKRVYEICAFENPVEEELLEIA
jgi:hypothetical protein